MEMKQYIPGRIAALQQRLRELGLDAAMIYDRENLIYFAGVDDLEGGALAVPAEGEAELFCLWMEPDYIRSITGIEKVTPFLFPKDNQSTMMGKWLKAKGFSAPKLGFTRYFISLKDYLCLRDAAPDMVVSDIATLCYELRSVKCPEEIERMGAASAALEAGMRAAVNTVAPAWPRLRWLAEAEYAMTKAGSQGSPFRMQVLTHSRQMHKHPYASSAKLEEQRSGGHPSRRNLRRIRVQDVPHRLSGQAS
jgi:Xaa-Pro aminopeptidase